MMGTIKTILVKFSAAFGIAGILASGLANLSFADLPGTLQYGEKNFALADYEIQATIERAFDQGRDRKSTLAMLLANTPTDTTTLTEVAAAFGVSPRIEQIASQFGALVKGQLKLCLAKTPNKTAQAQGLTEITIQNSFQFWSCFFGTEDLGTRTAVLAWSKSFAREGLADPVERMMVRFFDPTFQPHTSAIKTKELDAKTLDALKAALLPLGYHFFSHGSVVLVGRGPSFFLLHHVLEKFKNEAASPELTKKMERVIRHMSADGIQVIQENKERAVAFYVPDYDVVSFSLPYASDANSFAHEMTHARFRRLEKTMTEWARRRGLAIPYEIDGPGAGVLNGLRYYGGTMNLLNELNSWRTGESFDGGKTDEKIYEILKSLYITQAGPEAAKNFDDVWPLKRVEGTPVPRLILSAVRELNSLNDSQVITLGQEALKRQSETQLINVIRLIAVRTEQGKANEPAEKLLKEMIAQAESQNVKTLAARITQHLFPVEIPQGVKTWQRITQEAPQWMNHLSTEMGVPMPYRGAVATLLYTIFDQNIALTFDAVSKARAFLTELLQGVDTLEGAPMAKIEARIDSIIDMPGSTIDEKVAAALKAETELPYQTVLNRFLQTADPFDAEVIAVKHAPKMSVNSLSQLWAMALPSKENPEGQMSALNLLAYLGQRRTAMDSEEQSYATWAAPAIDAQITSAFLNPVSGEVAQFLPAILAQTFTPTELPQLAKAIVATLGDSEAKPEVLEKVRLFLVQWSPNPTRNQLLKQSEWGNWLIETLLASGRPNPKRGVLIAEYFRLVEGKVFGLPEWGTTVNTRLNVELKNKLAKLSAGLDMQQIEHLNKWNSRLWDIMINTDEDLSEAALFAIARHPIHLMRLEMKILKALDPENSEMIQDAGVRERLLKLISFTEPGFLSSIDEKLDQWMKDPKVFSASEKRILQAREAVVMDASRGAICDPSLKKKP